MQVKPSAKEVIPIAFLLSTPDNICPPVTNGPYPPPLILLLKEANVPKKTIFLYEKRYVLFIVHSIKMPISNTKTPIYSLIQNSDSFITMKDERITPIKLQMVMMIIILMDCGNSLNFNEEFCLLFCRYCCHSAFEKLLILPFL